MSEAAAGRLDSLKWVVVLTLVAGGVFGNSYFGDQPILYRVLALLVLALIAGWVASLTQKGSDFFTLVKGHGWKCARLSGQRGKRLRKPR